MYAWCRYTRGRFESTHRGVLDGLTAFFLRATPHQTYRTHTAHQTQDQRIVTRRRTERARKTEKEEREETTRGGGRKEEERERERKKRSRAPEWHVHVGVTLFAHFP